MLTILLIFYIFLLLSARKSSPLCVNVFFGIPGSGKSTYAAHRAKKCLKRGEAVYSNVNIKGTYKLNPRDDLGVYEVRGGKVIIDEAGLDFNSRNFKSFSNENRTFFKMHRHEETSVDVFSQSFDDMDKTIRVLARNFWVVKPSLIPYFIVAVRINRYVGVDKQTQQIVDAYKMGLPFIDTKYCFAPSVWKMFDSYEKIQGLKEKQWEKWGENPAQDLKDEIPDISNEFEEHLQPYDQTVKPRVRSRVRK